VDAEEYEDERMFMLCGERPLIRECCCADGTVRNAAATCKSKSSDRMNDAIVAIEEVVVDRIMATSFSKSERR
jgi:hypothetical protein